VSENEHNKRTYYDQVQRELDEANTVRARHQAVLDRMWHEKREAEIEAERIMRQLNPYLKIWD
jgi:hypothetical protein